MSAKKNYVNDAQVGPIHKVALNDFFNRSETYQIELTKINHQSGNYEGKFKGKIKQMSYSKDFENKVLDFISNMSDFVKEQKEFNKNQEKFNKEQKEFNQKIEKRIDKLDQRIDKLDQRIDQLDQRIDVLESFHKNDFKMRNKK